MKDVTFLLPAYNEEESIGPVISKIKAKYPDSNILVVNNNSKDKTGEIASNLGAEVILERKQGKSYAIQKGFKHANSDFIIMLDADNTYEPQDAEKLLKLLKQQEADLVLGSRLKGKKEPGAISKTNIIGNLIISKIASLLYMPISDVCTGYWAFSKEVVNYLEKTGINCSGFELEAEMFVKTSKGGFIIKEVPITYKKRADEPKLQSFSDGFKILKTLFLFKI